MSSVEKESVLVDEKHPPPNTFAIPAPAKDEAASPVSHRSDDSTLESGLPSPVAHSTKQRWNEPRINIGRTFLTFYTLFNMGVNDAAYGALLPYIQQHYNISYLVVSLVFAAPFIGYSVASVFNHRLHATIGMRGIAALGPSTRLVAYIVIIFHPPYPAIACILVLAGFGIGLPDAAWNAWMGDLEDANQLLGLAHGFYGVGATIAPLIGTAMIVQWGVSWWQYFYLPLVLSCVEACVGVWAFWAETGSTFRARIEKSQADNNGAKVGLRAALKSRITLIISAFLFMYVGIEVCLGGWITTFMRVIRHATDFDAGISATGFWLGLTCGRMILGFVTPLIGERLAVAIYLALCIGLELCFWLIPHFISSAIFIALLGFFLGPLFPAAIVAATKLLPKHLHVSAIGFAAAIGGGGAALIPFATGAIVQAAGVDKLEPIALALIVILIGLWLILPKMPKKQGCQ